MAMHLPNTRLKMLNFNGDEFFGEILLGVGIVEIDLFPTGAGAGLQGEAPLVGRVRAC